MRKIFVILMIILLSACSPTESVNKEGNNDTQTVNEIETNNTNEQSNKITLLSKIKFDSEFLNMHFERECVYDDNYRLIKEGPYEITYDDQNRVITRGSENFYYDSEGNLSYTVGKWESPFYMYFDENGLMIKQVEGPDSNEGWFYEYDEHGNEIRRTRSSSYGLVYENEYQNFYDEKGNLIKRIDAYGTEEYEYDESGRLLMCKLVCNNGCHVQTEIFEYDDAGNLTSRTIYDDNNQMTDKYSYEYITVEAMDPIITVTADQIIHETDNYNVLGPSNDRYHMGL